MGHFVRSSVNKNNELKSRSLFCVRCFIFIRWPILLQCHNICSAIWNSDKECRTFFVIKKINSASTMSDLAASKNKKDDTAVKKKKGNKKKGKATGSSNWQSLCSTLNISAKRKTKTPKR